VIAHIVIALVSGVAGGLLACFVLGMCLAGKRWER
jgi:hypothetical protein